MDTSAKTKAIAALINIILETVKEMGTAGAPEGVMYAAVMNYGITKQGWDSLVGHLIRSGKIRKSGNILYPVK